MSDLAVLLAVLFFLLCLSLAISHSLLLGRLTLLDWTVLGMGGVYGLGWAIVIWVTQDGANKSWESWLLPFESLYPAHTAGALILLAGVWFGWLLGSTLRISRLEPCFTPTRCTKRRLEVAMWVLMLLAFVMQWLYTRAYDGFIGLLSYSASIRSGIFTVENSLSFLQPFGGLALFASFGFWGLWLSKPRKLRIFLGLLISVLFSLYLLFSWRGRLGFLVYLATFVLGALLSRRLPPLRILLVGGLVILGVLVGTYYVSVWLDLKAADNLLAFVARELSFPFGSFFGQLTAGDQLFRAFKDFVAAPVFLLPSSWWSTWVEDVSHVNTTLILGAPKGEHGQTGGIPVDLMTLGLMQAHVFGVVIVGVMFGSLLYVVQSLLDRIPNLCVRAVFVAYAALKIAVLGAFYAQPALFISGNFAFIVSALVLVFFLKLPHIRWVRDSFDSVVKPPNEGQT